MWMNVFVSFIDVLNEWMKVFLNVFKNEWLNEWKSRVYFFFFFWKDRNEIILLHQTVVPKHKVCLRDH